MKTRGNSWIFGIILVLILSGCSPELLYTDALRLPASWRGAEDFEKLYKDRQYDRAMVVLLQSDPEILQEEAARKRLWRINDRLVTVQWYLQKGIIALLNNEVEQARREVGRALKIYPDHRQSQLMMKALATIPSSPKKGVPPRKVSSPPSEAELDMAENLLQNGLSFIDAGQVEKAKDVWYRGLQIVPSHGEIKSNLVNLLTNEGLLLFGQGDVDAAVACWREALKLTPENEKISHYVEKANRSMEKMRSIEKHGEAGTDGLSEK